MPSHKTFEQRRQERIEQLRQARRSPQAIKLNPVMAPVVQTPTVPYRVAKLRHVHETEGEYIVEEATGTVLAFKYDKPVPPPKPGITVYEWLAARRPFDPYSPLTKRRRRFL